MFLWFFLFERCTFFTYKKKVKVKYLVCKMKSDYKMMEIFPQERKRGVNFSRSVFICLIFFSFFLFFEVYRSVKNRLRTEVKWVENGFTQWLLIMFIGRWFWFFLFLGEYKRIEIFTFRQFRWMLILHKIEIFAQSSFHFSFTIETRSKMKM